MMESHVFENVWDALADTPEEAANLTMRSSLLIAIEQKVKSWGVTQSVAALRLGLTQPRLNDLMKNKINNFSLDSLIVIAGKADLDVQLSIAEKKLAA
jgi:predicted XRE-type DNA-binding protein